MHLAVVTGFLGSGKTTLVVALAGKAAGTGLKVAVVVNEIGEVGVDDKVMRQLGLNVWELASGCICCTIRTQLGETLETLARAFMPDLVLVEPSGAADPQGVHAVLERSSMISVGSVRTVALLDVPRLEALVAVLGPLVEAQTRGADVVLLTKTEDATVGELESAVEYAGRMNPGAAVLKASCPGALSDEVVRGILPWLMD